MLPYLNQQTSARMCVWVYNFVFAEVITRHMPSRFCFALGTISDGQIQIIIWFNSWL